MDEIEVVIKLPKEIYEKIQQIDRIISGRRNGKTIEFALWNGVKNGTVLPKNHGRLIDADKLEYTCNSDECGMLTGCNHCQYHIITEDEVDNASTVIEADKE